jgi:hypothetical protein
MGFSQLSGLVLFPSDPYFFVCFIVEHPDHHVRTAVSHKGDDNLPDLFI